MITPILDTLLHETLGRRAGLERFTQTRANLPLLPVAPATAVRADGSDQTMVSRVMTARSTAANAGARAEAPSEPVQNLTGGARQSLAAPMGVTRGGEGAQVAKLSREGGLIANLLNPRPGGAPMLSGMGGAAPIFGVAGPPPTHALAVALGQQIGLSGLFYESHLARWFEGHRGLDQLRREPQAQLPARADGPAAARPGASPSSGMLAALLADTRMAPRGAADDARDLTDLLDERLLTLVRQQLDVLSSAAVRWHGEAWPGCPMQWEIRAPEDESAGARDDDAEVVAGFTTRLRFDLPILGMVEVCLQLKGDTVDVYAHASSERGAAALAPATGDLERRFTEAGFGKARVAMLSERFE